MALDFDNFPVYDPVTKIRPDLLSDIWADALATFIQTLSGYLTQYGILPPNLTTAQRDEIQAPQNGQWIYNVTVDAPQFWQESTMSWRTVTFT